MSAISRETLKEKWDDADKHPPGNGAPPLESGQDQNRYGFDRLGVTEVGKSGRWITSLTWVDAEAFR